MFGSGVGSREGAGVRGEVGAFWWVGGEGGVEVGWMDGGFVLWVLR